MAKDKSKNDREPQVPQIPDEIKAFLTRMSQPPQKVRTTITGDGRSQVLMACTEAIQMLGGVIAHVADIANTAPQYEYSENQEQGY